MTREEAIKILKRDRQSDEVEECGVQFTEALDIAIETLAMVIDTEKEGNE